MNGDHVLASGDVSRGFMAVEVELVDLELSCAALGLAMRIRREAVLRETDGNVPAELVSYCARGLAPEVVDELLIELVRGGVLLVAPGAMVDRNFGVFNATRKERADKREANRLSQQASRARRAAQQRHRHVTDDTPLTSSSSQADVTAPPAPAPSPVQEEGPPTSSPDPSASPRAKPDQAAEVTRVWQAWLEATGRKRTVFTEARRDLIRRRLRDYEEDELVDAVRGWKRSPHHRGENASGITYCDLELLLRDARHVELFRDLERGERQSKPLTAFDRRNREIEQRVAELLRPVDEGGDVVIEGTFG